MKKRIEERLPESLTKKKRISSLRAGLGDKSSSRD